MLLLLWIFILHIALLLFRDYNNYDQVHFSDLKILPRDQQFVSLYKTCRVTHLNPINR